MNTTRCCGADNHGAAHRPAPLPRLLRIFRWIIPAAVLAVMPKCPVCLVGYIALASGIGVSVSVADHLRTLLVILCIVALTGLSAAQLRAWLSSRSF